MESKLEEIFSSLSNLEKVKKEHSLLVENYIKTYVDFNDINSLDKAVIELPESEEKLFLYDAIYDLKNKI